MFILPTRDHDRGVAKGAAAARRGLRPAKCTGLSRSGEDYSEDHRRGTRGPRDRRRLHRQFASASLRERPRLSEVAPDEPHAYVKLWKHAGAQRLCRCDQHLRRALPQQLRRQVSGEWMLAKAAQIAAEAPDVWRRSDKFIEAGDWLVWRLSGHEVRSLDFAAYKAQYAVGAGYPKRIVDGLAAKLAEPHPVGSAAGPLSEEWRRRTGIKGEAIVAVAVIDSHVALPAVHATRPGVLVGALGTSAAYLLLDSAERQMPAGSKDAPMAPRCPECGATKRAGCLRRRARLVRENVSTLERRRGRTLRSTIEARPRSRRAKTGFLRLIGGTATASPMRTKPYAA